MAERWEEIRRADPVNERRVAAYQRMLEAGEQISQARHRSGEAGRRSSARWPPVS